MPMLVAGKKPSRVKIRYDAMFLVYMTGNENTAAVRAEKAGNKERINGKHRN